MSDLYSVASNVTSRFDGEKVEKNKKKLET